MPINPVALPAQRSAILQQLANGSPATADPTITGTLPPLQNSQTSGLSATPQVGSPSNWAKILYGVGLAADAGSTAYGVAHGTQEQDPLVGFAGNKAAAPIGIAEGIGTYLLAKKVLGDKHPKVLNALLSGLGAAHAGAAVNNAQSYAKYLK